MTAWASVGILLVALVLFFMWRNKSTGGLPLLPGLPPHEFAYGATLHDSEAILQRASQFLSLPDLDPHQIHVETFVGDSGARNLKPLIRYVSSQRSHDFEAPKALLSHKELLKSESDQDSVIVFVKFGLKQPSELSATARGKIASLVRQFDTAEQSANFDSGECPSDYLIGNINVYPLAMDNTAWHNSVEFDSPKDAPVLEIRFMGLGGIFKYVLDEMTANTGASFLHLDGESL